MRHEAYGKAHWFTVIASDILCFMCAANKPSSSPIPELVNNLKQAISGEVRVDFASRLLYSTDASIYQIEPLGVIFPRHVDEIVAIVDLCKRYGVPVLARGAGSSLGGQAVGQAMIIDCSRYLDRLLDVNVEEQTALAEPGIVLNTFNRLVGRHGLQFGPDPASAERATLGGSLANNAAGAHSIWYGMAADHLLAADVVLSDGRPALLEDVTLERARLKANDAGSGVEAALYTAALHIRSNYAGAIRSGWPRTWRRASGYNLNYLLPWAPSSPPFWAESRAGEPLSYPPVAPGRINLATLMAGSEGTLAILRKVKVALVPVPRYTILGVMAFPGIAEACDVTLDVLAYTPSAVEVIPQVLVRMARSVPAYSAQLSVLDRLCPPGGEPPALLVVEFSGDDLAALRQKAQALAQIKEPLIAEDSTVQRQIWNVRKVGLGLLMSRAGDVRPCAFIEDLAVPVEYLSEFVRGMERILEAHGVQGEIYGHASAGCLHIRPLLNLKSADGVKNMRSIATQAVDLTLSLGGSISGEHGDGLARSEWYGRMFGEQILTAFRELKHAADPHELLNPGKRVALSPHNAVPVMDQNLRYGVEYRAHTWQANLNFASQVDLESAVEQCNGAGVCRKSGGVMCPSFQATQEEVYSTRGRANLLRALISGRFSDSRKGEATVLDALDLCLACKGCKAECPSAVDMAKLKYEYLDYYYKTHRRKIRDYLFGYIGPLARLAHPFAGLVNPILHSPIFSGLFGRALGLSPKRRFPAFSRHSLGAMLRMEEPGASLTGMNQVIFLSDAFTEYFYPEVGLACYRVLAAAGIRLHYLPVIGAGRTLISKGFLGAARRHALRVVNEIDKIDPQGNMPIVGVEPSEILTLCDEYPDLLPGDSRAKPISRRAYSIEEFLVRPYLVNLSESSMRVANITPTLTNTQGKQQVTIHGHCYQKARMPIYDGYPSGVEAVISTLEMAGYSTKVIDSGCCGMAGAFGYEVEHYDLSMKVGEASLLPAIRAGSDETLVAASGVSCRSQILDGAGKKAFHPIELVAAKIAH